MVQELTNEYYTLLEEIQASDFTLIDLTLYLDTHPNDKDALRQFNQFSHYSKQLKAQFEAKFGPLKQYGNSYSSEGHWNWNTEPWPWQV